MGFHLVGLEFSTVGKVRIPPARMRRNVRSDVFDDYAFYFQAIKPDSFDTAVATPQTLDYFPLL